MLIASSLKEKTEHGIQSQTSEYLANLICIIYIK